MPLFWQSGETIPACLVYFIQRTLQIYLCQKTENFAYDILQLLIILPKILQSNHWIFHHKIGLMFDYRL